jgi:hypothetical protein
MQWFLSESNWDERLVNELRHKLIRQTEAMAPNTEGVLIIDETGDLKDGSRTAHVGRQYLGNVGKIGNGVVSVSSHWADERIYYPLEVAAYTPASRFEQGKKDPRFRTKLAIATELVKQAMTAKWPFKAVVADSLYGDDGGLKDSFHQLGVGFVMALKPSHSWWHFAGTPGSLKEIAQMAAPRVWQKVQRTFRDGHQETWWALEIEAGPYGPRKSERAVVATTDPESLPELTTWYLVTNLPSKSKAASTRGPRGPRTGASLEEIVRLCGLRNWVEQGYKQGKQPLGWSQYQVRSERAILRHWIPVCCAFIFCWWQATQQSPVESWVSHPAQQPNSQNRELRICPQCSKKSADAGQNRSIVAKLAKRAQTRPELVGAGDHAQALLASILTGAATVLAPSATRLTSTRRRYQRV